MSKLSESIEAKILKKLPEGWEEQMMDLFSEGASIYEVMSEMRLHHNLWKQLLGDEHFREVVEMGKQDARAFWYKKGRVNLDNKDFNASLWRFNMENRFGWSTKTSTHDSDEDFGKAMDNDELEQRIEDKIRKLRPVSTDIK